MASKTKQERQVKMYIFKEYNKKPYEIKTFKTKEDFIAYLNSLCEKRGLELPTEAQALMEFYEIITDTDGNKFQGLSLSGFSNKGSRILGFYSKTSCDEDQKTPFNNHIL